ncbi:hypothetical protein TRFO_06695 [Tritrichomonas foetus]|uniref:Kinetoplast-associated protein n=1 Tax=Tritrichomonas foetus TaxID=1144522 RepID=A0A1J4JWC9_9EUKA|nr:hypothetical protein TRFO_06695 [Tritrichomonas foetus]|eukprot:OHT03449.1 hypothetical protein TRFO_06695 [Tritrichomonas foetus]
MSTSSFETSSSLVTDHEISLSNSSDEFSTDDPVLLDVLQLTKRHKIESKKFERELLQTERTSKKWTKTQVDTVAAIKDAELTTKQHELDRLREEFQTTLANKEAEIDNEIRQIDVERGELVSQVHSLEIELGDIKDKRKHDLIQVRSDLQNALRELEQKQANHANQIQKLQEALQAVTEKHKHDIELLNEEAATGDHLIDIDSQKIQADIERVRRQLSKTDQIHNRRMAEATQAIEMLQNEIESSKNRSRQNINETENNRAKYAQLQADLLKAEEQTEILSAQLTDAEQQKSEMRQEVVKLNRSLWNERRTKLLRSD